MFVYNCDGSAWERGQSTVSLYRSLKQAISETAHAFNSSALEAEAVYILLSSRSAWSAKCLSQNKSKQLKVGLLFSHDSVLNHVDCKILLPSETFSWSNLEKNSMVTFNF